MAGSSTAELDLPPLGAFYFDLASPEAYLTAERILQVMPVACEWIPIDVRALGAEPFGAFRCVEEQEIAKGRIERIAAERGLQAVRWPDPLPFDSTFAQRTATYARQIGRTVAFSLAAFRQAYAGGRDLSVPDNVLIAASACEMHPTAILKSVETRLVTDALSAATAQASARGVLGVPAIWDPGSGRVHHGDAALEEAAALAAARA